MKSPAFTLSVIAVGWATFAHAVFNSTNFPTHAKRNRHEQRHRWTLDGIEFAASAAGRPSTFVKTTADKPRNDTKAFTLTELLVTIVIILSITALLLPAVHNARNSAKALACSANLGRLCSAMLAYESMADSFPYGRDISRPPTDVPPGGYVTNSYGWWWFHFTGISVSNNPRKPSVLKCPAKRLTVRALNLNILFGNYGANLSICKIASRMDTEFIGRPFSRSDVRFPSETMLLTDSGYEIIAYPHTTINPRSLYKGLNSNEDTAYIPGLSTNSQRTFLPGQEKDAIEGRHPGKTVNVGFVDGHVERVEAEKLLTDSKGNPAGNTNIRWKPK